MNKALFSSATEDWNTPPELFARLDRMFHFQCDVAASRENHLCAKYFTKEENGLVQTWGGVNWMNPPYGRKIGDWIRKADEEAQKGNLTVALVPARVDTAWWQDYCTKWHYVFLRGRLKFSGSKNSAPFPSALVFFGIER